MSRPEEGSGEGDQDGSIRPDYVPGYSGPSMYDVAYDLPCGGGSSNADYYNSPCDGGTGDDYPCGQSDCGGDTPVITTCTPESCRQKCMEHMGLDIGECYGDKCYCKEKY